MWLKSGSEGLVHVQFIQVLAKVDWRLMMVDGGVRSTTVIITLSVSTRSTLSLTMSVIMCIPVERFAVLNLSPAPMAPLISEYQTSEKLVRMPSSGSRPVPLNSIGSLSLYIEPVSGKTIAAVGA